MPAPGTSIWAIRSRCFTWSAKLRRSDLTPVSQRFAAHMFVAVLLSALLKKIEQLSFRLLVADAFFTSSPGGHTRCAHRPYGDGHSALRLTGDDHETDRVGRVRQLRRC